MREDDRKSITWNNYRTGFRNIYILTILVLITGMMLDLIKSEIFQNSIIVDFLSLLIWIVSLLLILLKKCRLPYCFGIAAYTLVANIFATFVIEHNGSEILSHFYRDTVFIAFILTLTAYFVNKYHAFIIAGLYNIFILFFCLLYDAVLLENSLTLMFAEVSYSFIIFYFVKFQENTLDELNLTNHQMNQQNEELLQQQEEITSQRDILSRQSQLIGNRNAEIIEGIRFAKSIQESVLPKESDLGKFFPQYFVISKPKAVISGDFFWLKEWKGKLYLSMVDCTGHGVPGALVSMLANMYLGRAFIELERPDPAKILNYISSSITKELSLVDSFHARVGMDIALVSIDFKEMEFEYAGAFSPLYLIRRDNLVNYEATRMMIAGMVTDEKYRYYSNQNVKICKGDRIYLCSDGITDQFGGKRDKKFGYKRFQNALLDSNHGSMETQKSLFLRKWLDWKSDQLQVDDVLLIGVEI